MSEMCTHRKHPDHFSFFSFFKFSFSFSLFLLSGLTPHAESFQLQHVTGSLLCSVKKTQPHLNLLKVCVSFNPLHLYGFQRQNFLKFSNFILLVTSQGFFSSVSNNHHWGVSTVNTNRVRLYFAYTRKIINSECNKYAEIFNNL